jgi:hypothetical protein
VRTSLLRRHPRQCSSSIPRAARCARRVRTRGDRLADEATPSFIKY